MVEVFKTNIDNSTQAQITLDRIHQVFYDHQANFDLTDCDNILRIKCTGGSVEPARVISLLKELGFIAEVLPG